MTELVLSLSQRLDLETSPIGSYISWISAIVALWSGGSYLDFLALVVVGKMVQSSWAVEG